MPLGAAAAPPIGYVQFCEREPGDCNGVTRPELGRMRMAAEAAQSRTAVAAISYDWTTAFAQQRAHDTDLLKKTSSSGAAPASFNWTGVFAKAQAEPTSHDPDVAEAPSAPAAALMNPETWSILERTNKMVNLAITPREDVATYGVADYWATPLENGVKSGDCEDYVLEKRHQLVTAGLPASALSIAVVLTEKGEAHAVLVVATSTGDYVLDNRTPWILPWAQTPYRWRERQVAGSASHWAFPAVAAHTPQPARVLLASAR